MVNNYMSQLTKNIISLIILQGGNYLIPLITFPYLVRVLGVETFGNYSVIFSISQYLILFTDFGFNLTASKKIAVCNNDLIKISKIFWETIFCKLILFTISIVIVVTVVLFNHKNNMYSALVFCIIQILGTVMLPVWFFQGIERMSFVTVSSILSKIIILPLMFIFVKNSEDIDIAVVIQSLSFFASGLIAILFILNKGLIRHVRVNVVDVISTFKDSYQIFIAGLAISLYTLSTPIIIRFFSSDYEVGVFSAGDKIRNALIGCFLILGHAFYPRVNSLFATSKIKAFSFVRKIFYIQGTVTLLVSIIMYLCSEMVVNLVLGHKYVESAAVLKIVSPLFFLVTMSVVFANYLLLPLGYKKEYTLLPIFTSILHVITCSVLSYKYGAIGGALSILTVEAVTCITFLYIVHRKGILRSCLAND